MSWQLELAKSYRTASDLLAAGLIPSGELTSYQRLTDKYKFLLPRYYASLIDTNDPECPIRKQAIPHPSELLSREDLVPDPLSDLNHQPAPRITHRYPNRLLIHLTSNCSMYCRFCFRKTLLNELSPDLFKGSLENSLEYVEEHEAVEEVIFSGGDPFLVGDAVLGHAVKRLSKFPHVKRIRFHTRVPVTFPVRITSSLLNCLEGSGKSILIAVHFNHPKEITPEAIFACQAMRGRGFWIFNQSVLLQGVNDSVIVLKTLSEQLLLAGVMPYYLHHPDRAEGTARFDLSLETGMVIYRGLRASLPGYLVPKYVIDGVDGESKIPVEEYLAR